MCAVSVVHGYMGTNVPLDTWTRPVFSEYQEGNYTMTGQDKRKAVESAGDANALDNNVVLEGINRAARQGQQIAECWQNRLTLDNLRLAERYKEGSLEVILRISAPSTSHKVDEYCAVFYGAADTAGEGGPSHTGRFEDYVVNGPHDRKKDMVFVVDVDLIDPPVTVCPSLVRLQSIKDCADSRIGAVYLSRDAGFITGLAFIDWKARVPVTVYGSDELIHEEIESGAKVVDSIADDRSPQGGRHLFDAGSNQPGRTSIVVIGTEHIGIRTQELSLYGFQLNDVLFGPFGFDSGTVQRVWRGSHEVSSDYERQPAGPADTENAEGSLSSQGIVTKINQEDVQALMEKAMKEPGVAKMIELYDRAEAAYSRVQRATLSPRSYVSNSTHG